MQPDLPHSDLQRLVLSRLTDCTVNGLGADPELTRQALEVIAPHVDAVLRREQRDRLIVQAARLLPAGVPWNKAGMLKREAAAIHRDWRRLSKQPLSMPCVTVRQTLLHAAHIEQLPESQRQFLRILQAAGIDSLPDCNVSGGRQTLQVHPQEPSDNATHHCQ
ncbi:MAG: hypothetical protein QM601_07230 [Pseudoxanthomonas sp.]